MFFTLKSIHNKNFGPSDLLNLMGFNRLRIRYISKITDPEAHHGKPEVHYPHRKDFDLVEDCKLFVLNFVDMDLRDARITLVGKHVVKFLFQCVQNLTTGVHRNVCLLFEVKSTNIIEPCKMILMFMGRENGSEVTNVFPQHLLPEIRARIDHQFFTFYFYQNRGTQPFVFMVGGMAYITLTGDYRHALGGPCS